MADVARLAGVSIITVSRVINTPEKVAPATRAKIDAAIANIGYLPNLTAGSLASSRTRIIGAIVPTIDNSIFAETVRGLSETLARAGYQLLLGQTAYVEHAEEALVAAFLGRRVDGLVLTGVNHSALTLKRLRSAGVPVVETWDIPARPIDMVAGFSNFDAGRGIARYLCAQGYRTLGFAGGTDDRTLSRLAGFQSGAKRQRGVRVVALSVPAGASFGGGREALLRLIENRPRPDAIFFSNDALAVGALMACRRLGLRVPEDIAIAGFADLEIASEVEPRLTTVQVRSRTIGEVAATLLLTRLAGHPVAQPIHDLGYVVVPRASA